MKIYYISDIHASVGCKTLQQVRGYVRRIIGRNYIKEIGSEPRDLLIINGDIAETNNYILATLIEFKKYFKEIIYVLGNHEYYLVNDDFYTSVMKVGTLIEEINALEGVHLLEQDSIKINGITFSGATMWYELTDGNIDKFHKMSQDSEYIMGFNIKREHNSTKKWYNKVIGNTDVMICHIPLIKTDAHVAFNNTDFYLTNVSQYAKHTILGHTHELYEKEIEGNKFYSNAIGFVRSKISAEGLLKELELN